MPGVLVKICPHSINSGVMDTLEDGEADTKSTSAQEASDSMGRDPCSVS